MKRFVFLLTTIFMCSISHAETFNQYWYVENNTPIQTTCETGGDITLPTAPTKYGYDFIGWEKLPYIRIEYLESSNGTPFFYTGINGGTCTLSLEYRIYWRVNNVPYAGFYTNYATGKNAIQFILAGDNKNMYIPYNEVYAELGNGFIKVQNETVYTIIDRLSTTEINGDLINKTSGTCSNNSRKNTNDIRITIPSSIGGRIYYFKIYDNDILVRDFIPVLDPAGTPCMYDKVEGKFYYNAGTGQFVAGPVIGDD